MDHQVSLVFGRQTPWGSCFLRSPARQEVPDSFWHRGRTLRAPACMAASSLYAQGGSKGGCNGIYRDFFSKKNEGKIGTFVNDNRVGDYKPVKMHDGDGLRLGTSGNCLCLTFKVFSYGPM